jgi:hypothetical protein
VIPMGRGYMLMEVSCEELCRNLVGWREEEEKIADDWE